MWSRLKFSHKHTWMNNQLCRKSQLKKKNDNFSVKKKTYSSMVESIHIFGLCEFCPVLNFTRKLRPGYI